MRACGAARHACRRCSPPGSTRSSRIERQLVQQAAVVGRTFWPGSLAPIARATRARDLQPGARRRSRRRTWSCRSRAAELAGEREFAFKHVLIRDVAYGMLPKAVRCPKHYEVGRFIEERAGDRTDEVVALLAEHYGRAAALGGGGRARGRASSRRSRAKALHFLEAAGDAAAPLYSNPEAFNHYEAARELTAARRPRDARRGSARSRATSRCAWAASTPRSRSGRSASTSTGAQENLGAWATCTARSAPGSGTRASASRRSTTTRRAPTC